MRANAAWRRSSASWVTAAWLAAQLAGPAGGAAAAFQEKSRATGGTRSVSARAACTPGSESSCHGEVWYGWLDACVVLITARTSWKALALARGLERTRIWVGDHGRVGRVLGSGDAFRKGPSFEARAQKTGDAALLERLLATYRRKYPNEIGSWESRMRSGFESGERILIRYTPV